MVWGILQTPHLPWFSCTARGEKCCLDPWVVCGQGSPQPRATRGKETHRLPGPCNSSSARWRPRRDPNPGNPSKARTVLQAERQPTTRQQSQPGSALRHGQQDRGKAVLGTVLTETTSHRAPGGHQCLCGLRASIAQRGSLSSLCKLKIQAEEELPSRR